MQLHQSEAGETGGCTVNARQSDVIRAVRRVYDASNLLPAEDAAYCTRGLRRAWLANRPDLVRDWCETVAHLLEEVEGAWDARQACLDASSLVLALELV